MAIVALVIAFLFGNLYKFSFFSPDVHISLLDIVVLGITLIKLPKISKLAIPILVFFTAATTSLALATRAFSSTAIIVGAMYLARWLVYSLFFASIIQLIKPPKIKHLLYSLGVLTTVLGLVQYAVWPDVRGLAVAEWDPHYYRLVGTFLDPGFTGLILVFTLILLLDSPFWWGITYLGLALTYSRASYAAFLVSMAYIAWKQRGWKFFAKILGLFLATLILLPRAPGGEGVKLERANSIQARIDSWTTAWRIFTQHPVLGVGFNIYRYAQGASLKSHAGAGADSSLLFVAATTGLVGLLAYLWYLSSLRTIHYFLPALLVHSIFLNSLFYPAVMVWIALLLSASGSPPGQSPPAPAPSRRGSG